MIVRTEAVSLRCMDYGETSQIVTFYTRQYGTLSTIAKGARLTKSRFGSALQPMSYVQMVFYYKPNRDLHTLSECAHVYPLHGIPRQLEKLSIGLQMVELVRALLPNQEASPAIFNLLLQALNRLDHAEKRLGNIFLYFQLRLATFMGFNPGFEREEVRSLPEEGGLLILENGAIIPLGTTPTGLRASRGALRAFAICSHADLDTVMRMNLSPALQQETNALVEAYLRFHVEDLYPSRSSQVISQMFDPRSSTS